MDCWAARTHLRYNQPTLPAPNSTNFPHRKAEKREEERQGGRGGERYHHQYRQPTIQPEVDASSSSVFLSIPACCQKRRIEREGREGREFPPLKINFLLLLLLPSPDCCASFFPLFHFPPAVKNDRLLLSLPRLVCFLRCVWMEEGKFPASSLTSPGGIENLNAASSSKVVWRGGERMEEKPTWN